jgi:hypothetical protein
MRTHSRVILTEVTHAEWGVMALYLAMVGDASDNIKSLRGSSYEEIRQGTNVKSAFRQEFAPRMVR